MSSEIWKDVPNYEGLYKVSNLGNVKALERRKNCNRGYGIIKEHIMKPTMHNSDYYRVPLTNKNHIRKYYLVHRLVAMAFLPNENNFEEVNHIDGNKLNNNVNNLEWCTKSYNMRHAYDMGLNITKKQIVRYIDNLEKRIEALEKSMEYEVGGDNDKC